MANENRFYICEECGTVVGVINDGGCPLFCGKNEMKELKANSTDAAQEKHVPVVSKKCGRLTVEVGSVPHPMEEKHSIKWIYVQTEKGGMRKSLLPGEEPKAVFAVTADDKPVAVYAYCDVHGLWVTQL